MFPLFPTNISDLLLMQLLVIWLGSCIVLPAAASPCQHIDFPLAKEQEAHTQRGPAPDD